MFEPELKLTWTYLFQFKLDQKKYEKTKITQIEIIVFESMISH